MSAARILAMIAVMAIITYLPRVIPITVFRKRIRNRFVQSFLLYMPYGVLGAMVFPQVLYATASLASALCGAAVALYLAHKKLGLLPVALASTATVFVVEQAMHCFGM